MEEQGWRRRKPRDPSQHVPQTKTFQAAWDCEKCVSAQLLSRFRLCDPMDCRPPGSSVHGILQARILELVAIPFSRGPSWPRDWNWVSCIAGRFFTVWATRIHTHTHTHTHTRLKVCGWRASSGMARQWRAKGALVPMPPSFQPGLCQVWAQSAQGTPGPWRAAVSHSPGRRKARSPLALPQDLPHDRFSTKPTRTLFMNLCSK